MEQLRAPESGCPWDIKQTYKTILPYTIEEVYEVADAIERDDIDSLKDELGDLLFHVVFYAQLAKEDDFFELKDIVSAICEKLERRHPHVFSDKSISSEDEIHKAWEQQKHKERQEKQNNRLASLLDDIPKQLPELKRAQKIQKRVGKQGFDWKNLDQVWNKFEEELDEIKGAVKQGSQEAIQDEMGDLLFVCVNLARHLEVDADMALRHANQKFEQRFRLLEKIAKEPIENFTIEELEGFWMQAKEKLNSKTRESE